MTATGNLNFRLATVEDAIPLERLINTAFRNDTTTQVYLSADHERIDITSVDGIKASITQPDRAVYVATDLAGELVAHCSVRKLDETCAWFGMLAVNVNCQNRGLGSQVLAYAENYARHELGSKRMELDAVNTRADLIAWYKHRGYQETGETSQFPYEYHGDWKGVLRSDLQFVHFGKDL
ncbi:acyl-CoA N-acyltransferase [Cucurbitaria berberidis CBS 394.84]|uniref:Acyl-CoA N-acyltransferase n=1 Tax=Cucurbitaria berberidis CBS 394.84 TaxID=1168544 RepID=A0A9P4GP60_9PLEO|nr:acyl-CoA N-acyltransferase [Cucurbitaria berberidis CBS 394.84]KAF1848606.1 acyl-CoA N-acyltransferase [Cucurbitaria berberidis CBS 394.84]